MAKAHTGNPFTLNNLRFSFVKVFVAEQYKGKGDFFYSCAFLMDPETPHGKVNIAKIKAAEIEVAKMEWPDGKPNALIMARKDGNLKDYEGYSGMVFITAKNDAKPVVYDRDPKIILEATDGKVIAGCYGNATFTLWAQNNGYAKRINTNLISMQYLSKGETFGSGGGRQATPDDYSQVPEDVPMESEAGDYDDYG